MDPTGRPQVVGELQLDVVQTAPDPIVVVVDAHVPDGENRGEQAVGVVLRQYFFSKSCLE